MTPLFSLNNVSVHFAIRRRWFGREGQILRAVQNINLKIAEGETMALIGESGSGKTTLGHVVAGLRAPTSGSLAFRGKQIDWRADSEARRAIQIVFQDPFSALDPRMLVSTIIGEPLHIQKIGSPKERQERSAALAADVGLPADALNRYPHEFSGGQRQRIAIARALAPDPALIVADEPLSSLDVAIQSQILNLMREVQGRYKLSYLFISHDIGVVNHFADSVAVLYLGHLVEVAPRYALFDHPAHPFTRALLEAVPRIGRRRQRGRVIAGEVPDALNPPSGCVFHPRCPLAADICRTKAPVLSPVTSSIDHLAACHFKP